MKKILNLVIKKKWFDMIVSGKKPEEYREIKPYWLIRLLTDLESEYDYNYNGCCEVIKYYQSIPTSQLTFIFRDFDFVTFRNGYSKDAPTITLEFKGIEIREGNTEWGAELGVKYFVIKLGEMV